MGNLLPSLGRRKLPMLDMPKAGGGVAALGSVIFAASAPDPTYLPCDGRVIQYPAASGFSFAGAIVSGGVNKKAQASKSEQSGAVTFFKGKYYAANRGGLLVSDDGETFVAKTGITYVPMANGSTNPSVGVSSLVSDGKNLFYSGLNGLGLSIDAATFTERYTVYGTGQPGSWFAWSAINAGGAIFVDGPQKIYGFYYQANGTIAVQNIEAGNGQPYYTGVTAISPSSFVIVGVANGGYPQIVQYNVGASGFGGVGSLIHDQVNGSFQSIAYNPSNGRCIAGCSDGSIWTNTANPLVKANWTQLYDPNTPGFVAYGACFYNGQFFLCGSGGKVSTLKADGSGLSPLVPFDTTTPLRWIGPAGGKLFVSGDSGFIGEVVAGSSLYRLPAIAAQYSKAGQLLNAYMKVA